MFVISEQIDIIVLLLNMNAAPSQFLEILLDNCEQEKRNITDNIQYLDNERQSAIELNTTPDPIHTRKSYLISRKHPYQRSIQDSNTFRDPVQSDPRLEVEKLRMGHNPIPLGYSNPASSKAISQRKESPKVSRESSVEMARASTFAAWPARS